jgi:protein-tyrosine phosphatase
MRALVAEAGLQDEISIDSAGTSAHHIGEWPDRRSHAAAARHGVELTGRSRQFEASDFERFDYLVAMDRANHEAMLDLLPGPAYAARLSLMRDHEPGNSGPAEVPDPYYGDGDGFERVFQICRRSCTGLLAKIRAEHDL